MKTQEMKEKELKPCPFCGGAASTPRNIAGPRSEPRWYIYCKSEHHACLTVRTDASTEQAAIAAWNRRPASDSALYEALRLAYQAMGATPANNKMPQGYMEQLHQSLIGPAIKAAAAALASATPQATGE